MTLVSIITPCDPARAEFLPDVLASVERARQHVDLEWIVVVDGTPLFDPAPSDGPAGRFGDISLTHRFRQGASVARNTALAAATGDFIVPLDADDRIVVDGLTDALAAFADRPELGWVAANRVDLATGSPTKHWHGARDWAAGEFSTTSRDQPLPFHPSSIMTRRELALTVSGWERGLQFGEDWLFALECGEQAPGASVEGVLHEYRSWPGQTTAAAEFSAGYENRSSAIIQRINETRQRLGRLAIQEKA